MTSVMYDCALLTLHTVWYMTNKLLRFLRTFWKILWCLENVNIPSLIADEVAQNLCYLKRFIKKPPKLEKQEETCDKGFEIWKMI